MTAAVVLPAGQPLTSMDRGALAEWRPGRWLHACAGCGAIATLRSGPDDAEGHTVTVDGEGRPTVVPSIICPACGAHYTIAAGEIEGLAA